MVSDVSVNTALQQQANTEKSKTGLAEDFSQFLELLTIQLQNQDPLSPMETTEFTNQLVAFTGVEQQINTNQKLDSLVSLGVGSAFSEAQSYVGQDVNYISGEFAYTGGSKEIRYSLSEAATTSKINILDEQGNVVYTEDASRLAGAHTFTWDGTLRSGGKASEGTYQIKVEALNAEDKPIESTTVVSGLVRGVETQGGQIFLLVGERAVALSNVLNTSVKNDGAANTNDALTMALSYVGLDVTHKNSELYFDGERDANVIYNLPSDADRAQILIRDNLGNVIYNESVDKSDGRHLVTWDGTKNDGTKASAGSYKFEIDAIDKNDARIDVGTSESGKVTGVETKGGEIFLNVEKNGTSNLVNIGDILSANVANPST